MITDNIDGVMIDSDEDGFYMILSGEKGEYRFNIHGVAEQVLKQSWSAIGPWWNEGQRVHEEYKPQHPEEGQGGLFEHGYGIEDPKHPSHHDVWTRSGGV